MRGRSNGDTYEGLQEHAQTANKSHEQNVSGQLVTNHLGFLSPWAEDQSTSNSFPILLFSLRKTSVLPDERVGGILIMAS